MRGSDPADTAGPLSEVKTETAKIVVGRLRGRGRFDAARAAFKDAERDS